VKSVLNSSLQVTEVYPGSTSSNLLSFSSPGLAARQCLGKVQLRQETMLVPQLQRQVTGSGNKARYLKAKVFFMALHVTLVLTKACFWGVR